MGQIVPCATALIWHRFVAVDKRQRVQIIVEETLLFKHSKLIFAETFDQNGS